MYKVLIEKEGDLYVVYKTSTDGAETETIKCRFNSDLAYAGRDALELAESLGIGIERVWLGAGVPKSILEEGDALRKTQG
ncbi:MAG: hypothetical protein WDO74_37405 [Pseudomonadota bacterium]